ncbi:Trk system potassium transporter TrkA [Desulfosoma caldarium]|uniref:Trk system potassium uptake protein TrkA n=1 Tax=Desulfosoma caldarium TaxID=610254 RepID=A0A3N1UKG7_9BACT|nr:Trk system potassium transporter TrkA [Desulfosoma caldarium]ROQ89879.1 trk system potassium uptake protein TrkA [Desulfosoma caldarium]
MRVIIVGAGEVGFHIAHRLSQENKEVVVIDKNREALQRLSDLADVQTLEGSGSDPRMLQNAGIDEGQTFLAVTDSDETNLIATFYANILAPKIKKLTRIRNDAYTDFQPGLLEKHLNIDKIINPDQELVHTIEGLIAVPDAEDVWELSGGRIQLIGIRLHAGSSLNGKSLVELAQVSPQLPYIVGAIFRHETLIVPTGKDILCSGDLIYVVTDKKHRHDVLSFFGCREKPPENILIIGGGNIGLRLAKQLEARDLRVRLLEKDRRRCNVLSQALNKTIVLHGDGTDQAILLEENIAHMDTIVTLTGDEETNMLCSLLVQRLGAQRIITRLSKFAYMPIAQAVGLGRVVNPRLSAINSILQHVRRGKILSAVSLRGEEAEVLEAEAVADSPLVGRPLREVKFPKGALVLAVVRDHEIEIATGKTVISAGDRVVVLCSRTAVSSVEKYLSVRVKHQ